MTLFLTMICKAVVMGVYTLFTGKEMFPANPRGPFYRKPKV